MSTYEIRVAGPLGPAVASVFPELRATVVPRSVLLVGTVATVKDVLGVLTVLCARGLPPIDTVVSLSHHGPSGPGSSAGNGVRQHS